MGRRNLFALIEAFSPLVHAFFFPSSGSYANFEGCDLVLGWLVGDRVAEGGREQIIFPHSTMFRWS